VSLRNKNHSNQAIYWPKLVERRLEGLCRCQGGISSVFHGCRCGWFREGKILKREGL
jgi:hypothetical protein